MTQATVTPQDMENILVAKALQDANFRKELLANPKSVAEREFGITIPADIKIAAIQSPADTLTIVVPYVPAVGADGELSDADLESVAGGSKAGARSFFNGVGNYIVNNPSTVASAGGSAALSIVGAGSVATVACTISKAAAGK
ncbi:MAG: nitrile hydratase-like protein [Cyanobacteria bacterium RYN_339]|nr:nitrile hydratase-like protein [Cyanobacteria bacterium RYN_339]